ncbi:MAG: hypothetical protein AB1458_15025 [Bacteroidota bacterium]
MKTIKKILFAAAITLALFTLNAYTSVSNASAASLYEEGTGGVSDQQVIDYLISVGFSNVVIERTLADGDRICWANDAVGGLLHLLVNVEKGAIIGHEIIE